jgi:hypothetical protein
MYLFVYVCNTRSRMNVCVCMYECMHERAACAYVYTESGMYVSMYTQDAVCLDEWMYVYVYIHTCMHTAPVQKIQEGGHA